MTTIAAHAFHCQADNLDAAPQITERRRPGRPENISPELIQLLRGNYPAQAEPDESKIEFTTRSSNQLDPLRGLAVALVLSAVIWAVLLRLIF